MSHTHTHTHTHTCAHAQLVLPCHDIQCRPENTQTICALACVCSCNCVRLAQVDHWFHRLVDMYTSLQYLLQSRYPRGYVLLFLVLSLLNTALYLVDIVTDLVVAKVSLLHISHTTVIHCAE